MRAPDKRLIVSLSVSAAIAVAALAARDQPSQAQRIGNFSMGSRGGSMTGGGGCECSRAFAPSRASSGRFRAEPRFQRFNNDRRSSGMACKGKGKGKAGTDVSTDDPSGGDGRPGRRPPQAATSHGPTSGSSLAPASRSAPASPSARSAQPARPLSGPLPPSGGTPAQRNAINIPPGNENRFVKDEVVLEFASNFPRPGIAQLLARHRLQPDRIAVLHADQFDHRARPYRQPAARCARCCKASATRRRCAPASRTISTWPRRPERSAAGSR